MSYDPYDGARDEMYDEIARELYPEHKTQAIGELNRTGNRGGRLV